MSTSSVEDLLKNILDINSKYLRDTVNLEISTILESSEDFTKSYGAVITKFQDALNEAVQSGANNFTIKNTLNEDVTFKTSTAKSVMEGKVPEGQGGVKYGTYFNLYSKLIPELSQMWQLGHKSASVVTLRIAASIDKLRKEEKPNQALIQELVILLNASREIDSITANSKFTLAQTYDILARLIKEPSELNASIEQEMNVFKESEAKLILEFESKALNQIKGSAQSILGSLTTRLIKGKIDSVVKGVKKVDLTELTASPSFFAELKKLILDSVDPKITPKDKKRKSYVSASGSSGPSVKKLPRLRKAPPAAPPRQGVTAEAPSFIGVRSVLSYINARLPETVRSKMDYPRLENRTGRFASSTELLSITPTPKGFPSLAYTYQKNPYQVFEKGRGKFPWATPFRDPRTIIEESIREIAREVIEGRFYMRRL